MKDTLPPVPPGAMADISLTVVDWQNEMRLPRGYRIGRNSATVMR